MSHASTLISKKVKKKARCPRTPAPLGAPAYCYISLSLSLSPPPLRFFFFFFSKARRPILRAFFSFFLPPLKKKFLSALATHTTTRPLSSGRHTVPPSHRHTVTTTQLPKNKNPHTTPHPRAAAAAIGGFVLHAVAGVVHGAGTGDGSLVFGELAHHDVGGEENLSDGA